MEERRKGGTKLTFQPYSSKFLMNSVPSVQDYFTKQEIFLFFHYVKLYFGDAKAFNDIFQHVLNIPR